MRLSPFEQRWLAEALRRHEASHGALNDAALLPELTKPADDEARILRRAERLAPQVWPNSVQAMRSWQARTRWVIIIMSLMAVFSGWLSATGLISAGAYLAEGRVVNIILLLFALLLVPALSFVVWLVFVFWPGSSGQTLLGTLAVWMQQKLLKPASPVAELGLAWLSLLGRGRLLGHGMASLSHLLWLLALSASILGLLFMLATQRHVFVWETTILPGQWFVHFVHTLGQLPALFGFALPTSDMIEHSGSLGAQDEATRHAWAGWLIGCIVVYGLVPRLLAFTLSFVLWQRGMRRLKLDLHQPGFALLRARLQQASQALGVVDAAPATLPQSIRIPSHVFGDSPVLVGFELGDDLRWPPDNVHGCTVYPRIDSRQERQQVLDALQTHPASSLLIVIDSRLTPDRGSLNFVNQLAAHSTHSFIWLLQAQARTPLWREALRHAGWADDALLDDAQAQRWLEQSPCAR